MKKRILTSVLWVLMTGTLLGENAKEPMASITMSFGEVYIKHIEKTDWEISKVGTYIYRGDKMRTKDSGKAEVTFINGSIVFLGNETEMEFLDTEEQTDNANSLFLFFGSIWNKVTEGTDYSIESVHALATVRGTEFSLECSEKQCQAAIKEGEVEIENEHGSVTGGENTRIEVSEETAPTIQDIDKKDLPEPITFESEIIIQTILENPMFRNKWYLVEGSIRNESENTYFTENIQISITSSDNLFFKKQKKNNTRRKELEIETDNGKFRFYILSKGTDESFTISSSQTVPETRYIRTNKQMTEKPIFVRFIGDDGTKKQMKVIFEKQE